MKAKQLNLGLIGLGNMGGNHLKVLSGIEPVNIVGLSDMKAERASVAHELGVPFYTDYRRLLECSHLDAVVITTPTRTHKTIALDAIQAGKHAIVEKPITLSPEDGREVVSAARARGVKFTVGHIERHNPVLSVTKDALGGLGRILSVEAKRVSPFPQRHIPDSVIVDLAIHELDLIPHHRRVVRHP